MCSPFYNRSRFLCVRTLELILFDQEILIITSLATIMMDLLRHELLTSLRGLPLGLLASRTAFTNFDFLVSPEFRYGISGVEKKTRLLFTLFITICSILALLAGPSSALLLLPQTVTNWPAGGATFYLVGANETIWPSQLNAQSIGGANCQSPTENDLSLQQLNTSSCIWSGYKSILQWWQSAHLGAFLVTIPLQDGMFNRNIRIGLYSGGSAAYGVSFAPCIYAQNLAGLWGFAIFNNAAPGSLSKLSNLQYRVKEGTTVSMNSSLPIVRTTCFTNDTVTYSDIVNEVSLKLPQLRG
jgi:hypothetical protein